MSKDGWQTERRAAYCSEDLSRQSMWAYCFRVRRGSAEGDEAALLVGGVVEEDGLALEGDPVGGVGVGGHDEEERAGAFEGSVDFKPDHVAGFDLPFVEPDAEAVGFEAFGEVADSGLVFGAVADENVVLESLAHVVRLPCATE
jgi:hypothetical protein